jgi:hypothetical protein
MIAKLSDFISRLREASPGIEPGLRSYMVEYLECLGTYGCLQPFTCHELETWNTVSSMHGHKHFKFVLRELSMV